MKNDIFHYYNRGCNRQNIFFNPENYLFLIRKIKQTYQEFGISVIAYCLMPNHYHFMIKQTSDRRASDWIKSLFIGYVQAINIEQNRSGTLFEGRTKCILIDKEEYLLHIIRYIHCNPLTAGIVDRIEDWHYSNYLEWVGMRKGKLFDRTFFSNYFRNHDDYRAFIREYAQDKRMNKQIERYLFG